MSNLIDELEAAAKKANLGLWLLEIAVVNQGYYEDGDLKYSRIGPIRSCDGCPIATEADGSFVSLANPESILKLCAMVRESQKSGRGVNQIILERDSLLEKLRKADKALHHYSIGRHFILRDGEQIEDGLIAREALKKLRGEV